MLRYFFASLLVIFLTVPPSFSQEPSPQPTPAPVTLTPNKTAGLELPPDQNVEFDEGFIPIQAQCKGDVKWLVVSQVKVKYITTPGNSLIVSVPPQGGVISVFAVGLVDGKITEFVRTNITVKGIGPTPPNPPPNPPILPPNPPNPPPNPPNPAPQAGPLHITFVVDLNNTTPELAQVLNSQSIQQAVKGKGNFLRLYDMKSPIVAQRKLDTFVTKVGGSAVMIVQNNAGQVLQAIAIPRTEPEVLAIINQFTGGKQ